MIISYGSNVIARDGMYKCCFYYTCNTHSLDIEMACRTQLAAAVGTKAELVSVSREPIEFGIWNEVVKEPRGPLTMHKQILTGLKRIKSDIVFLCESDVLYHPSHFDFEPEWDDTFYYNTNVWKLRYPDGHAIWTDDLQQVSGCCADRNLLLEFYQRRVIEIEQNGFNRHYEPGPKTGSCQTENWQSAFPNLDIRHNRTLTKSKWSPGEFRNKKYAKGWQETDGELPGWGNVKELMVRIRET